jgi:hypothetical protein
MGEPVFQQEKDDAINQPRDGGVSTLWHSNTPPAQADASSLPSPEKKFGLTSEQIKTSADLDRLEKIAGTSKTFANVRERLRRKGVTVVRKVERLDPKSGGGRTWGAFRGKQYLTSIDPETVLSGHNVLDVYIHEFGHVVEEHDTRWTYQKFLNQVQRELGIRETPDSHKPPTSQ